MDTRRTIKEKENIEMSIEENQEITIEKIEMNIEEKDSTEIMIKKEKNIKVNKK